MPDCPRPRNPEDAIALNLTFDSLTGPHLTRIVDEASILHKFP